MEARLGELRLFYDTIPELYDAARPGYPELLADDVSALCGLSPSSRVLDIGCGTGKATKLWADRGHCVTALDIGPNLLRFCQHKLRAYTNVQYACASFEDWDPGEQRYDLITAATAFHWVGPIGLAKVRSLLARDGHVAIFWHTYLGSNDPFREQLDEVYRLHAPQLYQDDLQARHELGERQKEESLLSTDGFTSHRIVRYYHYLRCNATEYVALLRTFPTHTTLPQSFYDAVALAVRDAGGTITQPVRTTAWIAKAQSG